MEENTRNPERAEDLLKNLSVYVSMVSFWVISFSWNYLLDDLEFVPRLGMGAALSWVVFLHVEATGMIIMTMMREKWRSEARDARAREALALAREARSEAREAQAQAEAREFRSEAREARSEAREAQVEAREAQVEARETQVEAREAQARSEAREAQAQAVILELRRQLREARGEGANGAENA